VSRYVLDASALLALVNSEAGAAAVGDLLDDSVINAVNLSEAAATLCERGVPAEGTRHILGTLRLTVVALDEALAYRVAELRRLTKKQGLSLGDRACLATAERLSARAVTADRMWTKLRLDIEVLLIR
jgi:ribonuclease VapC